MRKPIVMLVLIAGLTLPVLSWTAGYKVTKVVKVESPVDMPVRGPLRWSPDGTMLAHFIHGQLLVSDTLGEVRTVTDHYAEALPRWCEWVSNDKLAVTFKTFFEIDSILSTLAVINVPTGHAEVVETFMEQRGLRSYKLNRVYFEGPFLSLQGNAHYVTRAPSKKWLQYPRGSMWATIDEYHWLGAAAADSGTDDEVLHFEVDGLYAFNPRAQESRKIEGAPTPETSLPHFVRSDLSYAFRDGVLFGLRDSTMKLMHEYAGEPPAGTYGCAYFFSSFNPEVTELLFNQACEGTRPDGSEFVINRIGTFDYSTHEFTILDTLTGLDACTAPVYASDGKMIACLSGRNAYIIYREER